MQSLRAAFVFLMGLAATVSALPVLAGDAIFRASMDVPTCADVEYNSGLEVQAFPSTWQNVFSLPFPNPIGNARIISIPQGGVVSLAFTPSLANPVGNVETSESPGNPGGALTLSISPCRADYRREVLTNGTLCIGSGLSSQDQLVFVTGMGDELEFLRPGCRTDLLPQPCPHHHPGRRSARQQLRQQQLCDAAGGEDVLRRRVASRSAQGGKCVRALCKSSHFLRRVRLRLQRGLHGDPRPCQT